MSRTLLYVMLLSMTTAMLLGSTIAAAQAQTTTTPAAKPAAKKSTGPVILKFKVPKAGVFTPAGQPIIITGVSMEPNATAVSCTVGLQTNSHGYGPTQGTGPAGRQFVNWTGQTEPLSPGLNKIEAELICLHPGQGNVIIKHVNHNVTATVIGAAATSSLPTVTSHAKAPSSSTTATPPAAPKASKAPTPTAPLLK